MKKFTTFLIYFVAAGIGFYFGAYEVGRAAGTNSWGWGHIPYFLALILFLGFVQIIIHEAGHLLFGLLSGYSFASFKILNVVWIKEEEGIRRRSQHIAGMAGQCLMVPPQGEELPPYFLYNAGGMILNLIASLVTYILLQFTTNTFLLEAGWVMIGTGLFIVFLTLLPIQGNDTMNIISAWKSVDQRKQINQMLLIYAEMIKGKTYAELVPYVHIDDNTPITSNFNTFMLSVKAGAHTENFDFASARKEYEKLWDDFDELIDIHKSDISREYLFVLLLTEPDHPLVEDLIEKEWVKPYKKLEQTDWKRVFAVYDWKKTGDLSAAQSKVDEAREALKKVPTRTDQKLEQDLLEYIEKGIEDQAKQIER